MKPNNVSNTFITNVQMCLKIKQINIGELEKSIGKSAGYFSKIMNPNSACKNISLDVAYKISEKLDISINRLIAEDFATNYKKQILEAQIAKLTKELANLNKEETKNATESK